MQQKKYAYVRVSDSKQNEARQMQEILKLGIKLENIFIEKVSGKTFNRQKYNKLLKCLKKEDILYISSVDRLGRDYKGIIKQWHKLTKEKKVNIKVLDMPILDTDKKGNSLIEEFVGDMVLLTLAFQAEQEWQNIKARQKMGIAIAKEKGIHLGRPKTIYSENDKKVVNEWRSGKLTLNEAMKNSKRQKTAFYKLVSEIT